MKQVYVFPLLILIAVFSGCAAEPRGYGMVDVGGFPIAQTPVPETTPGSLWRGTNSRNRLFSDFRARDVGDIITVLIVDKTSAKGEATTETGSSSGNDYKMDSYFGMPLDLGMTDFMGLGNRFSPSITGGRETEFSGNGTTERNAQITATVAVRVMQVLSNGNLYVEGAKETTVNRERQYVTLAGIIRPEDITSLNTITSDSISDLRVELSGDGVVTDKQRPGWLTTVFDNVWPF